MRTLYVTDLDGTLLGSDQRVSEKSVRLLNGLLERGLHFTVATARSAETALPLLKQLNLTLPAIFINGVFVADPRTGEPIQSHYVDPALGKEIAECYLRAELNPIVYTIDHDGRPRVYYRGVHNYGEQVYVGDRLALNDDRLRLVKDYAACLDERIITINAIDIPERLQHVYDRFASRAAQCATHFGPDVYAPGYYWLEIMNARATKRQAVQYLKETYGFERMVCFGDNLNDLSMFAEADECYAVANAHAEVKRAATGMIDSHDDDGVAKFIQKHYAG